jgi:SAM-dependent methyltransferase
VELTNTPICRLCGRGPLRARLSFSGAAGSLTGEFRLVSCDNCGTWQVNPHPGPKLAQSYFNRPELWAKTLDPEGRPVSLLERSQGRAQEYRIYAQAMTPFLPERGLLLDIGAGTGLMLSLLPDNRPKLAVEPNPVAAEAARERGLEVSREWAENLTFPKVPIGAIILNQTLDHLPRPDLFLSRALSWLSPGGLTLITGLINPLSLPARVYGPRHRLWSPWHQIYPPLAAVTGLLKAQGLEILEVWRPYFVTPFGGPWNLTRASLKILATLIRRPRPGAVSPPWPGNVYSLLARKNLLLQPLKVPSPQAAPLASQY